MIYLLWRGRRCIVVSIDCVLLYFNCGIVAIGKNYREEEEDDDEERLDDFEGAKASKPF